MDERHGTLLFRGVVSGDGCSLSRAPGFVDHLNVRNFTNPFDFATAGDLGPEGLTFIDANDSPNDKPLLVVANEISGSTTIFEINRVGRPYPKGKGNPKK